VLPHDFALAVIEIKIGNGTLPQTEMREAEIYSPNCDGETLWDWMCTSPTIQGSTGTSISARSELKSAADHLLEF
jgi:hypothetical protein